MSSVTVYGLTALKPIDGKSAGPFGAVPVDQLAPRLQSPPPGVVQAWVWAETAEVKRKASPAETARFRKEIE